MDYYEDDYITIDFHKKRYKKLYSFLFFKLSEGWKKLPEINWVGLTERNAKQTIGTTKLPTPPSMLISTTVRHKTIVVYLIHSPRINVEVAKFKEYKNALSYAQTLAEKINVNFLDYTKSEEGN